VCKIYLIRKESRIMYVDYDIPICDGLRNVVLEEIAILDRAYREDDMLTYLLHEDAVETYLKTALEDKDITEGDLDQMFRRFGWR